MRKTRFLLLSCSLERSSFVSISFCHDVSRVCLSGSASLLKPSEVLYGRPVDTEVLSGCSDEEWNSIEAWVMMSFEEGTVIQEIIRPTLFFRSRWIPEEELTILFSSIE